MDRARLLSHFDTLADTPDAVAKLRELVLSLAIRGNLVPQQSSESQGKDWQAFLAKCDQAKPEKGDLPPFALPASWRWAHLDDVADYRAAEKVEPSAIRATDWVLDLEEIEKDTSRILRKALFKEKQSSSTKARFLSGDVLYGKLRPYLNKVVLAREPGYCTTEIVPIRGRGLIAPDYLCVFLRSPDFVGYTNEKSYGMKMPRLGTEDAEAAWIAMPPPAEQKRIVARVEELLALCDELEARQTSAREQRTRLVQSAFDHLTAAATPADFRRHAAFALQHFPHLTATPDSIPALRQAILSLAVQGHLVAQDPDEGPASLLLRALQKARTGSAKPAGRLSQDPETDERSPLLGQSLPAGWEIATLGEIADVGTGSTPTSTDPTYYNGGDIPWITSAATSAPEITAAETYVTGKAVEDFRLRKYPAGTIIVALYGQGKTRGQASRLRIEATMNQACSAIVLPSGFDSVGDYLMLVLREQYLKLREQAAGGAQPNLNGGKIKSLRFPVPPLAEQQRIVAKVAALMSWCDELEARLAAAQSAAAALLDSSLHALLVS